MYNYHQSAFYEKSALKIDNLLLISINLINNNFILSSIFLDLQSRMAAAGGPEGFLRGLLGQFSRFAVRNQPQEQEEFPQV